MNAKTILITGCSSGIGFDAATTLNDQGWRVFATCRKASDCRRLSELGFESLILDYADSTSITAAMEFILERTDGTLDALFNNGAYAIPGLVEDLPRDALRAIFETNLFGQFELINQVIPIMRAQGHGHIVNCSSVLGFTALPFRGAYNATKFAMEGLTDTLRVELMDTPIKIVLIEPGPINTRIRENSQAHFDKWIDVENSARQEWYKSILIPRLYKKKSTPDRFELSPAAVTEKLISALASNNPNPRYYVTVPTYIAGLLKRILSSRGFDRFSKYGT